MKIGERFSRLLLSKTKGIGPRRFLQLLTEYNGELECLLALSDKNLNKNLGQRIADEFISVRRRVDYDKYINGLKSKGISLVVYGERSYPFYLSQISDYPICLFYKGNFDYHKLYKAISVVGTRNLSQYGENSIRWIVKDLVKSDFGIVSGLANGSDSISHLECIENKGYTLAVIPTAPNVPVPINNRYLYEKILNNQGGIVSENDDDLREIHPKMFALRNRIIAGLTLSTLIIEADIKSGALITAENAFDNDRFVFAIPGDIFSLGSRGTNNLIKINKAKLIQSAGDVLSELGYEKKVDIKSKYSPNNPAEEKIINLLSKAEYNSTQLSTLSGLGIEHVNRTLSVLEIGGVVQRDIQGNLRIML